ncbi:MAG TPA: hypothetical protein VMB34_10025 [Acetobacteraceae bacterium]|nr:hypothetical protein [Acetobacteraceae bacterium]
MTIDIDRLSEQELIDLNHCIVARLRVLRDMRAHVGMLEFRIGDRVTFHPPGRERLAGILTRYNRKTVTVIADDGMQWNVAPSFLAKAGAAKGTAPGAPTVTLVPRR